MLFVILLHLLCSWDLSIFCTEAGKLSFVAINMFFCGSVAYAEVSVLYKLDPILLSSLCYQNAFLYRLIKIQKDNLDILCLTLLLWFWISKHLFFFTTCPTNWEKVAEESDIIRFKYVLKLNFKLVVTLKRVGHGLANLEKAAESQKNQLPSVSSTCYIHL